MNCADCGAEIELRRGQWAETIGPGAWSFTCRTEVVDGKLLSADYHYIWGTEQRRVRKPDDIAF